MNTSKWSAQIVSSATSPDGVSVWYTVRVILSPQRDRFVKLIHTVNANARKLQVFTVLNADSLDARVMKPGTERINVEAMALELVAKYIRLGAV